jgi:hypothetical protein
LPHADFSLRYSDQSQPDQEQRWPAGQIVERISQNVMIHPAKAVIADMTAVVTYKLARQKSAFELSAADNDVVIVVTARAVNVGRDVTQRGNGPLLKSAVDPKHGCLSTERVRTCNGRFISIDAQGSGFLSHRIPI